jgi:hypothetical protein
MVKLLRCAWHPLADVLCTGIAEMLAIHSLMREIFALWPFDIFDSSDGRYYILREDLLGFYINDVIERLSIRQDYDGWEVGNIRIGSPAR